MMSQPQLPPSSTSSGGAKKGRLVATILSTYDLPSYNGSNNESPPPSYVTLTAWLKSTNTKYIVSTGPPVAKHQYHKNSYRFVPPLSASSAAAAAAAASSFSITAKNKTANNNNNSNNNNSKTSRSNELIITAPLRDLYGTTALFTVVFNANPDKNLVATVKLSGDVHVNETRWFILDLIPEKQYQQQQQQQGRSSITATTNTLTSTTTTATTPLLASSTSTSTSTSWTTSSPQPTLRLKIRLEGPYRPEIQLIITLFTAWFAFVDYLTSSLVFVITSLTQTLPQRLLPPTLQRIIFLPVIPMALTVISFLPVLLAIGMIGFPFFLPLMVLSLVTVLSAALLSTILYFSSADGRDKVSTIAGPMYATFQSTPLGQRLFYDTGKRPSLISLMRFVLPTNIWIRLLLSISIDLLGSSSYLVPVLGETFDIVWAPVQTLLIIAMYDDVSANLKYVSFAEEILPFTDAVPSALIGWFMEFGVPLLEKGTAAAAAAAASAAGAGGGRIGNGGGGDNASESLIARKKNY